MPVRLRCGLGDPAFNATFLVAPKGQPGIEPGLQLHCLRVLATRLLTQPDAKAEREQKYST